MRVIPTNEILRRIGRGDLFSEGYSPANLAAVDTYTFSLAPMFYALNEYGVIDGRKKPDRVKYRISRTGTVLQPGRFIHLETREHLKLDARTMVMLGTHPSLAKLGLDVTHHSWLVPPGSSGPLTLETSNNGPVPVRLFPGMKAAKALFIDISKEERLVEAFRSVLLPDF